MKKNILKNLTIVSIIVLLGTSLLVLAGPPEQAVVLYGFVLYPNSSIVNGTALGGNINVSAYNSTGAYLGTDDISEDDVWDEGKYVLDLAADTVGLNSGDNLTVAMTYPNGTNSVSGYSGSIIHYSVAGGVQGKNMTLSDTQAPSVVSGLTTTAIIAGEQLNITWTANTDDTIGYLLYRDTVLIANLTPKTNNSYLDTSLTNNQLYTYNISAYDIGPNFAANATTMGTPVDTLAPAQVVGESIMAYNNTINLSWSAVTQNSDATPIGSELSGYHVYSNMSTGVWHLINTTDTLVYFNNSLTNLQTYYFKVAAYDDDDNEGTNSSIISGMPSDSPQILADPINGTIINSLVIVNISITSGSNLDSASYEVRNSTNDVIDSQTNNSIGATSWNYNISAITWAELEHSIIIFANDTFGQSSQENFTYLVDDTNPAVSGSAFVDEDDLVRSTDSIALNVTVTDSNTITSVMAANSSSVSMNLLSGNVYSVTTTASALGCSTDGDCEVTFTATDVAGNINDTHSYTFVVDDTNPAVSNAIMLGGIINLTDNKVRESDIIDINITVSDTNDIISVLVNGQSMNNITETVYNYSGPVLNLCGSNDGSCTLQFNATDDVGNVNSSTTLMITVDDTSPSIITSTLVDNYVQNNSQIVLTVNVTDVHTAVHNVTATTNTAYSLIDQGNNIWNATINLTDDRTNVSLSVYDIVGNTVIDTSTTFTIDDTAPIINSVNVTDSYVQNDTNVTVTVNITEASINSVIAEGTALTLSNGLWTGTITLLSGNSPVNVIVTDNANNQATDNTITFTIDDTAPIINSVTLSDDYVRTGQIVNVTINITENNVSLVTANSVNLTKVGALWLANLTMPSSSGLVEVLVIDEAGNNATHNTTTFISDNIVPTFSITVPVEDNVYINDDGNVTFDFIIVDANISVFNVSLDGSTNWGGITNGSQTYKFTNLRAGTHTAIFTARDEAGNNATAQSITFQMVRPLNVSEVITELESSLGSAVTNLTISSPTQELNNNESADINTTLTISMDLNISNTNASVSIPDFNGLEANWQETVFTINTNESSSTAVEVASKSGTSMTKVVLFDNIAEFLAEDSFNMAVITFDAILADLDVLFVADDVGQEIYKLSTCSSTPTTIANVAAACYMNTSSNVTLYLPHFSGGALANDTLAPTVNITAPTNNSIITNSYFTFAFDVWEANPNNQFCKYNLTSGGSQVSSYAGYLTTPTSTGTKYSYTKVLSNLSNSNYDVLVNCTDLKNQSTQLSHNFTVTDTIMPIITSINTTSSGTTEVTLDLNVVTDENANCKYGTSDDGFVNLTAMTTTGNTSHSKSTVYTSSTSGTYYVRCNDSAGNVMTTSNTTAFSVTISTNGTETTTETPALATDDDNETTTEDDVTSTIINESTLEDEDVEVEEEELIPVFLKTSIEEITDIGEKIWVVFEELLGSISGEQKQNIIEMSNIVSKNVVVERKLIAYEDLTSLTTKIKYEGQAIIKDFIFEDVIPKSFAANASDITITGPDRIEIIDPDPIIAAYYAVVEPGQSLEIIYEVDEVLNEEILAEFKSSIYVSSIEEKDESTFDKKIIIWVVVVIILIIILVLAFTYFNKYKQDSLGNPESSKPAFEKPPE